MTGLTEEQLAVWSLKYDTSCNCKRCRMIRSLIAEVRRLREAAKGQLVVVNTAIRERDEATAALDRKWIDGHPPRPYDSEWFIAETTYGDRVVLTALPEEYTYDFKTADETYIMRKSIKRWLQFHDSQYVPFENSTVARADNGSAA